MDHPVYPGHHGLIPVDVNSTQIQELDFVIKHAAVLKMSPIILKLAMTTRKLSNVHQGNVSIFNVTVTCQVNHLV